MNNNLQRAGAVETKSDPTIFLFAMLFIEESKLIRITENGSRLTK